MARFASRLAPTNAEDCALWRFASTGDEEAQRLIPNWPVNAATVKPKGNPALAAALKTLKRQQKKHHGVVQASEASLMLQMGNTTAPRQGS